MGCCSLAIKPGDRVVIIDDVATTGGSTIKAVERARSEGLDNIRKHVPDTKAVITRDELMAAIGKQL